MTIKKIHQSRAFLVVLLSIKFLPFGLIAGASAGEAGLLMKLYGSCLLDETENSVDSDTVN